jgi:hypothetical protein
MVNDIFPDTAAMQAARNAAAQAMARQNTSILNVEAARNEALKRVAQGRSTTVPTSVNPNTIVRSNAIGFSAPSVTAMRNLTPNGPVQQAMMPSMQTPPGANIPLFTNVQSSRPFSSGTTTQRRII